EHRLPLLFYGEVRDVVLQHVVLRLKGGELRYEAGVAGRIEDNISDAEQGKAGRSSEKHCRACPDEPFAAVGQCDFHKASCGWVELHTLRADWIEPVQGNMW